jgi:hypothetical protein
MERDEAGTHERLRALNGELIRRGDPAGRTARNVFTKMSCEAELNLGDYRGVIEDCERASTSNDNPDIAVYLTAAYAQAGDLERARRWRDELMRALPSFRASRHMKKWSRNSPAWHEQQRDHVVPGLRKAGVPE